MINQETMTKCTCGQAGHGNAHEPGCQMNDYRPARSGRQDEGNVKRNGIEAMKIHESEYGDSPNNFHVTKDGSELRVELTYPPYTDADNEHGKCRYVYVDQESVRASDGVRLHYDFERDGFVVEQPKPRMVALGKDSYDTIEDWIEVGFFPSWRFNDWEDGAPPESE